MRLLISACLCLLALGAQAQVGSEGKSEKQPLALDLTAGLTRVCLKSSLPLALKITNRGDQEITILKFELWQRFKFWQYREPGGYGSPAFVISCSVLPDEDVASSPDYSQMLKPNDTLTSSFKLGLQDDFFPSPGRYKVETSYDHTKSNLVEVEVVDCSQN